MKKLIFCIVFIANFIVGNDTFKQISCILKEKCERVVEPFFIVLMASRNNAKPCEWKPDEWVCDWSIKSVLTQNYSKDCYHVLYIDDASSDGTVDRVTRCVNEFDAWDRVSIIQTQDRRFKGENFYNAVHLCPNNAVIVELDGDDAFMHAGVLSRLAQEYRNSDTWLTYGQFVWWPGNYKGGCRTLPDKVIKQNNYRNYRYVTSALRSFYAGLFKCIKKEDLIQATQRWNGQVIVNEFPRTAFDVAMMMPMLEMSGFHSRFIPDVLYIYNYYGQNHDGKDNAEEQLELDIQVRTSKRYGPLVSLDTFLSCLI